MTAYAVLRTARAGDGVTCASNLLEQICCASNSRLRLSQFAALVRAIAHLRCNLLATFASNERTLRVRSLLALVASKLLRKCARGEGPRTSAQHLCCTYVAKQQVASQLVRDLRRERTSALVLALVQCAPPLDCAATNKRHRRLLVAAQSSGGALGSYVRTRVLVRALRTQRTLRTTSHGVRILYSVRR